MTFSKVFEYILMFALILLTLFNLYALTAGKKKKKNSVALYKQTLTTLENKAFEEMKKNKISFDEKHGYINDLNEGILLTFDNAKRMMGITLKDAFYLIPFSEVLSCTSKHDTLENGKFTQFTVEVETQDSIITLLFGSRPWREKSTFAQFILADTQEFCSLVTGHCITSKDKELQQE